MSEVLIRRLESEPEFLAGDHTLLKELLHPAKSWVKLGYSLAHARVRPEARSKRHRLGSSEVYDFLAWTGVLMVDEKVIDVERGTVVYVPPHAVQSLENTGTIDIEFLCLVDPAWRSEDEEVLEL